MNIVMCDGIYFTCILFIMPDDSTVIHSKFEAKFCIT